jgi:threonine/homoserine/homoserine lactone efflux protein
MTAGLALNLTPGPDMLYVAARGAAEGRRAGVVSALGIGAGTLVHITALALGLSALLAAVPLAYDAVRYAGAAYLVYHGARALLARRGEGASVADAPSSGAPRATEPPPPGRLAALFRQGVVTNVLNPKVALFFLAFLPQFVDPARGSAVAQTVFLGLLFDCSGTIVNVAVAIFASGARRRWLGAAGGGGGGGGGRVLQRVTGAIFVALGVRLALAGRR